MLRLLLSVALLPPSTACGSVLSSEHSLPCPFEFHFSRSSYSLHQPGYISDNEFVFSTELLFQGSRLLYRSVQNNTSVKTFILKCLSNWKLLRPAIYRKTLNQSKVLSNLGNEPGFSVPLTDSPKSVTLSHWLHELSSVLPLPGSLGQGENYRQKEPGTPTLHRSWFLLVLGAGTCHRYQLFLSENGLKSFAGEWLHPTLKCLLA